MAETPEEFTEQLSPAQTESVRRLLAHARVTDPMPTEVQTQLDDVLRELAADRSTAPPRKPVVTELATRRRRRARALLVAAAAVTVIGVGGPRWVNLPAWDSTAAKNLGSGESARSVDQGSGEQGSGEQGRAGAADAPTDSANRPKPDGGTRLPPRPRVRPDRFAQDAAEARDRAASPAFDAMTVDPGCLPATDRARLGEQIPVRYSGREAVLVLSNGPDGTQTAELYLCGEKTPRQTAVLPAN
ncbi:MAG: hypothetical protein ACRCYU_16425 [Nocardioides sp.]